jgi:hypothetical protein
MTKKSFFEAFHWNAGISAMVLVFALVFAGCGGDSDSGSDDSGGGGGGGITDTLDASTWEGPSYFPDLDRDVILRLTFNKPHFSVVTTDSESTFAGISGTYTATGNTILFMVTSPEIGTYDGVIAGNNMSAFNMVWTRK